MDLETLIDILVKEKGGTREQYLLLMDKIAHHESKGDPTIHQIGGGPGRGLFQFEEGEFKGGKTAANRLIQYLKRGGKSIPKWLKDTQNSKSLNAANLTPDQQKMLFLGNMREHPKANFTNVWDEKETVEDFWANYHWAGDKKDEFKRRKSFRESQKEYIPIDYNAPKLDLPKRPAKRTLRDKYTQPEMVQPKKDAIPPVEQKDYKLDLNAHDLSPVKKASYEDVANKYNIAAHGGLFRNMPGIEPELNRFDTGGLHETNPNGGIPQGIGSNGKMNTVEEGETSFDFEEGKYIFSNRIKI